MNIWPSLEASPLGLLSHMNILNKLNVICMWKQARVGHVGACQVAGFFSRFPALFSILASSTARSTATDLSVAFNLSNLSNRPNFMYMF